MDTRDPLRLHCPECGAQSGQMCTSEDRVCNPHEERRRRRQSRHRHQGPELDKQHNLGFEKKFIAAGSVWLVTTNSRELLWSIGKTLPAASHDGLPDLCISFHVDHSYDGTKFEAPYFRSCDHLFFGRYSPRETILIDQLRRFAIGSISRQTAVDANYWNTVLLPVLLGIVSASIGITPVHCACLTTGGSGLLISGQSGVGKSTLSAFLCLQGFGFISDDCAYIARSNAGLLA